MFMKTITYNGLDGNPITEDFWFHLRLSDIAKMELSAEGGSFRDHLIEIVNSGNGSRIIAAFEDIIAKSYGIRGTDNKKFSRSDEISKDFMDTDAYSVLFMELVTDAEAGAKFVNGIIPESLTEKPDPDKPTGPRAIAVPHIVANTARPIEDVAVVNPVREMTLAEMQAAIDKAAQPVKPVTPVTP